MFDRDMAYHQGTVWVFPLGGYYLVMVKIHAHRKAVLPRHGVWASCFGFMKQLRDKR